MQQLFVALAKLLALTSAAVVVWVVASGVTTALLGVRVPESGATPLESLAAVSVATFANVAVTAYAARRSRSAGWKLGLTILWVYFGVHTLNAQIETLYFNAALRIPPAGILSFVLTGAAVALTVAPLTVLLFGPRIERATPPRWMTGLTPMEVSLKAAAVALLLYPALYFLFGYYVLWQLPEARELYSGSRGIEPFVAHMRAVLEDDPWIYPWQALRGLLWTALALPVVRGSRAGWKETGVVVGLLFLILMNAVHLVPNPYLTPAIRLAHFVETGTSNFLLGFAITWLFHRHHASGGDLLRPGRARPGEAGSMPAAGGSAVREPVSPRGR